MKLSILSLLLLASSSNAQNVTMKSYTGTISVTNMSPENGTCFTPVWIGLQDGTFDIFNVSEAVIGELEDIVEDGDFSLFKEMFREANGALYDTVVGGQPICAGQTVEQKIEQLNLPVGVAFYLSYVAMILPSNDAFVANDDPFTYKIFDTDGSFISTEVNVIGSDVLDAGTEKNDELPDNIPTLNQATPDTGDVEGSVVTVHSGFNEVGSGGILDLPFLNAADFTASNYHIMKLIVNMTEWVQGAYDPTTTDGGSTPSAPEEAPTDSPPADSPPADSPPASAPTPSTSGSPPTAADPAASGSPAFVASSWLMVLMMVFATMLL